jgi:hypothetical protein
MFGALHLLMAMTENRKETSMKTLQRFLIVGSLLISLMPIFALGKGRQQRPSKPEPLKITVNIKDGKESYYVPVTIRVSTPVLAMAQADNREKQIAYLTRILQQNTDNLRTITEGFKHYGDVRLYLDVVFDPGPDAHIHSPQADVSAMKGDVSAMKGDASAMKGDASAMKICGRICCTNSDGKQCCAVIICPVDKDGNCAC